MRTTEARPAWRAVARRSWPLPRLEHYVTAAAVLVAADLAAKAVGL